MRFTVPGRVCLVGEHCDWAGGAAIVAPLDLSVHVSATAAETLSASAFHNGREWAWTAGEDPGPLRFVPAVAAELGVETGAVRIDGDLPAGRGFSSSAAVCVGIARALANLHGRSLTADEAAGVAYNAEHGRVGINCGRLDPLACAHGTPLFLQFSGEAYEMEAIPAHFDLAVGSFRVPRDTPGILAELGRYHRGDVPLRDWDGVARVGAVRGAIEGFGAQAIHARDALFAGDLRALGGAMDTCQEIYEEELMSALPMLRAPGLVKAVRALRAAGALGAKFSGAGGEGSVIGLYKARDPRVIDGVAALDRLGLDAFGSEVFFAV